MGSTDAIDWLLAGDPAIRWQAMRNLAGARPAAIERERRRAHRIAAIAARDTMTVIPARRSSRWKRLGNPAARILRAPCVS